MNNTIDWKRIVLYSIGFVAFVIVWTFIAVKISSCNGYRNSNPNTEAINMEQAIYHSIIDTLKKRDSIITVKNDSLERANDDKDRKLSVLKYQYETELSKVQYKSKKELYESAPTRPIKSLFDSLGLYCYDSVQQAGIDSVNIERKYLRSENEILVSKDSTNKFQISNYKLQLRDCSFVNDFYKADNKVLRDAVTRLQSSKRKWWQDAALIISSAAIGYTIKTLTK